MYKYRLYKPHPTKFQFRISATAKTSGRRLNFSRVLYCFYLFWTKIV